MTGFHGLLAPLFNPPPSNPYGLEVLYHSPGGNERFVFRGDKCGLMNPPSSGGAIGGLPSGWRYGNVRGETRVNTGVRDTPFKLDGIPAAYNDVRQTIAVRYAATTSLFNVAFDCHVVLIARHLGTPYYNFGDNRSDAMLLGALGAQPPVIPAAYSNLFTIEGIEGQPSPPNNTFPIPWTEAFTSMPSGTIDDYVVIMESIIYGTTPTARIRLINRITTVYDSGPRYPTGSALTAANASVVASCVDIGGTMQPYLAVQDYVSFMCPRDVEVPLSVIRDAVGY